MVNKTELLLKISPILLAIIIIIIFRIDKVRKFINSSSVKNFFLILSILFIFLIVYDLLNWLLLNQHFYTLSVLLGCFWGIVYSNIELRLLIRKKIKGNYFYNNIITPSIFLVVIIILGISLLLCIFYHHFPELCRQILANTWYFIPGFVIFYCVVFYLRFYRLEKERGTIYFKNKILK